MEVREVRRGRGGEGVLEVGEEGLAGHHNFLVPADIHHVVDHHGVEEGSGWISL